MFFLISTGFVCFRRAEHRGRQNREREKMCFRALRLLRVQHHASLVSFRQAPSFKQAPVGTCFKHDPHVIPAYVLPEVITEAEESALLAASSTWFDRLDYNDNHVDSLIHHYKEFYRPFPELVAEGSALLSDAISASMAAMPPAASSSTAPPPPPLLFSSVDEGVVLCQSAITKCHRIAQKALPTVPLQARVHFLQLNGSGFIRAHVDESRNSSGIVAGLTMGSGRVMTLTHPKHEGERIDLLLRPRSFYMLVGTARTEWEHSVDWNVDDDEHIARMKKSLVVDGSEVIFDGSPTGLRRGMRTAMIFRGLSPMDLLMHRNRHMF